MHVCIVYKVKLLSKTQTIHIVENLVQLKV